LKKADNKLFHFLLLVHEFREIGIVDILERKEVTEKKEEKGEEEMKRLISHPFCSSQCTCEMAVSFFSWTKQRNSP